ncbi:MAG: TlpA family protein disulfide reductase [Actinomycetota bacterium]|nr:TlpA family protein disulfide reductase [Actinomycetota bacterium]
MPEARAWSQLYPEYEDEGLEVLMVSTYPQDTAQTIEDLRNRGDIASLPWAVDQTGEVTQALGVNALETTVIVDREGEIVYQDTTSTDYETLKRELEEVL